MYSYWNFLPVSENVNFPRFLYAVNDTPEPRAHTWNEGVVSEEEGGTSMKLVHHLAPPSLIIRSMIVRRTRRRWRIPCNTLGCTLKSSGSRVMKAGESRLSFPPQTWFFAMLPVFPHLLLFPAPQYSSPPQAFVTTLFFTAFTWLVFFTCEEQWDRLHHT